LQLVAQVVPSHRAATPIYFQNSARAADNFSPVAVGQDPDITTTSFFAGSPMIASDVPSGHIERAD
jgi:hypothetical protein